MTSKFTNIEVNNESFANHIPISSPLTTLIKHVELNIVQFYKGCTFIPEVLFANHGQPPIQFSVKINPKTNRIYITIISIGDNKLSCIYSVKVFNFNTLKNITNSDDSINILTETCKPPIYDDVYSGILLQNQDNVIDNVVEIILYIIKDYKKALQKDQITDEKKLEEYISKLTYKS
jgi:hypothetical protein